MVGGAGTLDGPETRGLLFCNLYWIGLDWIVLDCIVLDSHTTNCSITPVVKVLLIN